MKYPLFQPSVLLEKSWRFDCYSQPRTSVCEQLVSTHNIHILHAHQHALHSSQLPSTTLLCTQLTNTKHSWQNGTRCRDGVNVLWCRSHLVWLVFEGSIPTCACFHLENFFVTLYGLRLVKQHVALWPQTDKFNFRVNKPWHVNNFHVQSDKRRKGSSNLCYSSVVALDTVDQMSADTQLDWKLERAKTLNRIGTKQICKIPVLQGAVKQDITPITQATYNWGEPERAPH